MGINILDSTNASKKVGYFEQLEVQLGSSIAGRYTHGAKKRYTGYVFRRPLECETVFRHTTALGVGPHHVGLFLEMVLDHYTKFGG
eukprot:COSAG02_NODE_1799_length_10896_cov_8.648421_6_plen_86_part_00